MNGTPPLYTKMEARSIVPACVPQSLFINLISVVHALFTAVRIVIRFDHSSCNIRGSLCSRVVVHCRKSVLAEGGPKKT